MRGLIAIALLLMASQASAAMPEEVSVWHDDQRNVTCWLFWGFRKGGISCLPDNQINQPILSPGQSSGDSKPANTPAPPPQNERFQL